MTPAEVCRRLPPVITPDAICRLASRGAIPGAVKVGTRWVLPPSAPRVVAQRLAGRAERAGR